MTDWHDVCPDAELSAGECRVVDVDDVAILVTRLAASGELAALEDLCSHDALPLSEGEIANDEITCPAHGAQFCLKTGNALSAPAYEGVATLPVRVNADGMIQVRDDRWD